MPIVDKTQKKKRKTTKSKSKKVEVVRAVKFKAVEIPKIKHLQSTSDIFNPAEKQSKNQPVIIHNYMYPPQQEQKSRAPLEQQSIIKRIPYGETSDDTAYHWEQWTNTQEPWSGTPAPLKEPEKVKEFPPRPKEKEKIKEKEQQPRPIPESYEYKNKASIVSKKALQLQERGGPYTRDEARLVFGLDLRTKEGTDTLKGLIENGIVK